MKRYNLVEKEYWIGLTRTEIYNLIEALEETERDEQLKEALIKLAFD